MVLVELVSTNDFRSIKNQWKQFQAGLGCASQKAILYLHYVTLESKTGLKQCRDHLLEANNMSHFNLPVWQILDYLQMQLHMRKKKEWATSGWNGEIKIKTRFRHLANIRKNRTLHREMRAGGRFKVEAQRKVKSCYYTPPNQYQLTICSRCALVPPGKSLRQSVVHQQLSVVQIEAVSPSAE